MAEALLFIKKGKLLYPPFVPKWSPSLFLGHGELCHVCRFCRVLSIGAKLPCMLRSLVYIISQLHISDYSQKVTNSKSYYAEFTIEVLISSAHDSLCSVFLTILCFLLRERVIMRRNGARPGIPTHP